MFIQMRIGPKLSTFIQATEVNNRKVEQIDFHLQLFVNKMLQLRFKHSQVDV